MQEEGVISTQQIWTIGHSTRSIEEFLELLKNNQIQHLVDVRRFPGSKRYPHFNGENLARFLSAERINYTHALDLGGRRTTHPGSRNTAWRNSNFRGYADYMETIEFQQAIGKLVSLAIRERSVVMCAEAVWWQCHRSLISDFLLSQNWEILHILSRTKVEPHRFTAPARVVSGVLTYHGEPELF